ncbi:hypothetical protein J6590_059010 [Homalodisca vitripennis]|nr:hypothetical protein J6590_059010 [Homalodisca vitripennis]
MFSPSLIQNRTTSLCVVKNSLTRSRRRDVYPIGYTRSFTTAVVHPIGHQNHRATVSSEFRSLVTNILHWSRTVLERNRCWNGKWGYCASTLHSLDYQRRRSCCPATNLRAA